MTDMSGKTCVVTGATSGIGCETARILAAAGAEVIGVGRDEARCRQARAGIRADAGSSSVSFERADLSSQAEVRALAARIRARCRAVDVLVNNAGIFTDSFRLTGDGIELQLAVNHLAGFLLTRELLPCLSAAPAARVIGVSSGSHFSGRMHWDDLGMRRGYFGLAAYDQSKLAVVLFTREMARRLGPGSRVSTYAVDPGLVRTDIGAKGTGLLVRLVWRLRTRNGISARDSARWIAFLASDPGVAGMSGLYWKEKKVVEPSEAARSAEDAERLWNTSETLARPGATAPDYEPNLLPSSSMAR